MKTVRQVLDENPDLGKFGFRTWLETDTERLEHGRKYIEHEEVEHEFCVKWLEENVVPDTTGTGGRISFYQLARLAEEEPEFTRLCERTGSGYLATGVMAAAALAMDVYEIDRGHLLWAPGIVVSPECFYRLRRRLLDRQ